MTRPLPPLALRLASGREDIAAAQALRHRVFVEELGASGGSLTDRLVESEADRFDEYCEHLILTDPLRGDSVIGTTRLMTDDGAARAGMFAAEAEFHLEPLRRSGKRLLEVGRTCLHPAYRGGAAMLRLWMGLAGLVEERGIGVLFGLASFPETDPGALVQPLSCLHHDYLAPVALRPRSRSPVPMGLVPPAEVDRRAAMLATPALVKAYLRLGGRVGEGAYLDRAFGCIDVCMIVDTATLSARARAIYRPERK